MGSSYHEPLHRQLERLLHQSIQADYPPGSRIPSEVELAKKFNVSLQTTRRALAELVRQGILTRRRGLGSFVNPPAAATRPVALLCDEDLSAMEHPYATLRLIRECQALLEEAGCGYQLFLGHAAPDDGGGVTSVPFLQGIEKRAFSAVIALSPLPAAFRSRCAQEGIEVAGRVPTESGATVAGDLRGFFKKASDALRQLGCERLFTIGEPSPWLAGDPSFWASPPWEKTVADESSGVIVLDPYLPKASLESLPPWKPGSIATCGFAGEPAQPMLKEAIHFDLDLTEVARALVGSALDAGAKKSSPLLVDAWSLRRPTPCDG